MPSAEKRAALAMRMVEERLIAPPPSAQKALSSKCDATDVADATEHASEMPVTPRLSSWLRSSTGAAMPEVGMPPEGALARPIPGPSRPGPADAACCGRPRSKPTKALLAATSVRAPKGVRGGACRQPAEWRAEAARRAQSRRTPADLAA